MGHRTNWGVRTVESLFHFPACSGVMAIPQGMSYSMLARLPPQFGLYVNMMYPLIYMIFGTGKHVAVGVSAIEDLLLGESITRVIGERERLEDIALTRSLASDPKTSPEARVTLLETANMNEKLLAESRLAISIGMSACVGLVFALMRILQAGLIADLLAVPVLSAFSTASAFLVGTSQLKHALGLSIPASVEDGDFKLLRWGPQTSLQKMTMICFPAASSMALSQQSVFVEIFGGTRVLAMICCGAICRQWWFCITHIHEANWMSATICFAAICILAACKYLNKRYYPYCCSSSHASHSYRV